MNVVNIPGSRQGENDRKKGNNIPFRPSRDHIRARVMSLNNQAATTLSPGATRADPFSYVNTFLAAAQVSD